MSSRTRFSCRSWRAFFQRRLVVLRPQQPVGVVSARLGRVREVEGERPASAVPTPQHDQAGRDVRGVPAGGPGVRVVHHDGDGLEDLDHGAEHEHRRPLLRLRLADDLAVDDRLVQLGVRRHGRQAVDGPVRGSGRKRRSAAPAR
jgi:hypothetical protein